MEEINNKKNSSTNKWLIVVIVVLIVGIGGAIYTILHYRNENSDLNQEFLISKQQLEDEYENLNIQYEGIKINIQNDSLLDKLTAEQLKVQSLLDELKTVKDNSNHEINRLNKELFSLRKVMRTYIIQIDSLNTANKALKKEKEEITNKYEATRKNLNAVSQQKENLTKIVTQASKLDAVAVSMVGINSKGKVQKKIKKMEILSINFTLSKNITTEPGIKTIYIRIMKPDGSVLVKSMNNVFPYENKEIAYSSKREVEYDGEEQNVDIYWNIEEFLPGGIYKVDIFADGNRIGGTKTELKD